MTIFWTKFVSLSYVFSFDTSSMWEAPSSPQKLTEGGSTCSLGAEGREDALDSCLMVGYRQIWAMLDMIGYSTKKHMSRDV